MTSKSKAANDNADNLIPDPAVARRFGVTLMTLWRWDHDPELGFPKRIKIRTRNYRRESELDAWEVRMARKAIARPKAFGIHANQKGGAR